MPIEVDDIEITPEMIEAGVNEFYHQRCGMPEIPGGSIPELVEAVLRAALSGRDCLDAVEAHGEPGDTMPIRLSILARIAELP